MAILNETFGNPDKAISEIKLDFYFKALSDLTIEEINDATINLANTKTIHTFPTPAEIREAVQGNPETRAIAAFDVLLGAIHDYGANHSVEFQDGVIGKCVEAMGGWMKVCDWPADQRKWNRLEFEKLYKAYSAKAHELGPVKFTGELEANGAAAEVFQIGTRDKKALRA
jgi:hypothetical protein